MLRITRLESDGQLTWKLEGRLVGPWVDELRTVAEAALAESPTPAFDVAAVSFVDRKGEELLRELVRRRVRLEDPSGFVRELLHGGQS